MSVPTLTEPALHIRPPVKARPRVPVRLVLFGVVAVAAFALGFLAFDVTQARILVQRYGYYTISLTFAWALFACHRMLPVAASAVRAVASRERWQAGGVILACTLVAVLTTPVSYKILYDEMVLQATAADMHLFREVSTVMRAYTVDGMFVPLDTYLDKRPFFFPYLVSLLHDVTGYREGNAFALNIALLPVVLAQVYLVARRFAAHAGALAGVIALGTLSTLAHSATGAGMEMLNVAMALASVQFAIWYLEEPTGPRLTALVLGAVLLAQARYESSLYVAPVALVVIEGWRRSGRIIMPVAAILAPALLVPYAIHNTYLSGTPLLWELRDNAESRFGRENLLENLEHAKNYFFNTTPSLTNSFWLSAAGFLALGFVVVRLWQGRRSWRAASPEMVVLPLFGSAVVANLSLLMFYYWGQLDDPTVARLGLPFAVLLALCLGYAVHTLNRPGWRLGWISAGAACLAYLWSGVIANEQHTRLNTLGHELEWERRYVGSLPPGDRLILTNKSSLPWMLQRIPAVSIEHARRRVDQLRYQLTNQTFREVLVFQTYRPTSAIGEFQLVPGDRLPDWFVLEPLTERRFGTRLDRVSRLVEIRPDRARVAEPGSGAAASNGGDSTPPRNLQKPQ